MADESYIYAEGAANAIVRQFTIANATAITKGTWLRQSGDRTGIAHTGTDQIPLGPTVEEKEASDGKTTIGCQRTGVVDAIANGTVTTGDMLRLSSVANRLQSVPGSMATSMLIIRQICARAIEDATDGGRFKAALILS